MVLSDKNLVRLISKKNKEEKEMIYMETKLIVHPDKMAAYREMEKSMYPALEKFGVKVVGSWATVIGDENEFTLLSAWEDMGQIQKTGMAMMQDKEFQAGWQKVASFIKGQHRRIMLPMPNSPLK
jgi:hypothetical protein